MLDWSTLCIPSQIQTLANQVLSIEFHGSSKLQLTSDQRLVWSSDTLHQIRICTVRAYSCAVKLQLVNLCVDACCKWAKMSAGRGYWLWWRWQYGHVMTEDEIVHMPRDVVRAMSARLRMAWSISPASHSGANCGFSTGYSIHQFRLSMKEWFNSKYTLALVSFNDRGRYQALDLEGLSLYPTVIKRMTSPHNE